MRGSDSERMIAEIEAFLRTGEAPPAAPEPPPVTSLPVADFQVDDMDPGIGATVGHGAHSGLFGRVRSMLRKGPLPYGPGDGSRWSGGVSSRPGGAGGHGRGPGRLGPSGGWSRATGPGLPAEAPRWTPLRAVIVCAVLAALLVVPMLFSQRSSSGPGSADHASAAPAGPGYAFLRVNRSGTPVRWNPCSPVYYETDLKAAPAYAATDLQAAVSDMSRATGILFVDSGTTGAFPSNGPALIPGGQAGPVVIAWADPSQAAQIGIPVGASGADALARSVPVAAVDQAAGHGVYVTGTVLISAAADRLPEGFGPGGLGVMLLHQLGHLVGLGNVHAPGEIMNTTVLSSATSSFGAGDLAGLNRLGTASGCLQVPTRPTYEPTL